MQETLLVIHIAAVALWFGGVLALSYGASMLGSAEPAGRKWYAAVQGNAGRVLFSVAGILILITGVWMVLRDDGFEFSQAFVSVGFLVVVVGTLLGIFVYAPACRAAAAAIDAGDAAAEAAANSRLMLTNSINAVLLLVAIVAMVAQWGV